MRKNFGAKTFLYPQPVMIIGTYDENGKANAIAKPSMPMVGASKLLPAASTRSVPMIGPVQEKLTMTSVNAINIIERNPLDERDLSFNLVDQLEGSVSSKAPKKEAANTTRMRKKMILTTALVDMALSAEAPKTAVIRSPNPT